MIDPESPASPRPSRKIPWVARLLSPQRRARLAETRVQRWIVLVSLALASSSLAVGLQLDDHVMRALVRDGGETGLLWVDPPHPIDMFRLVDGDDAAFEAGLESGMTPWYADRGVRLAFSRPLAALTHWLDYAVWPEHPWLMHAHSLLWLLVLGLVMARLYRRLEAPFIAGLATLFFAFDWAHGTPAGWIANRNALLAGVFGALALTAHIDGREGGRRGLEALAVGVFALALLSAEASLGWCGFFFAYAICLDPGGWRKGLVALFPLGTLVVAWRLAYRALGYGATGNELYIDPGADPIRFIFALVERLPQLVVGQLGWVPPGFVSLAGRRAEIVAAVVAWLLLLLFAFIVFRRLRHDRRARFYGLGALLAMVPVCATQPHARLTLIAGVGLVALAARFIASVVLGSGEDTEHDSEDAFADPPAPAGRGARMLAAFWLVLLGFLAPLRFPLEAYSVAQIGRPNRLAATGLPDGVAGRSVFVLSVPDPMFMCASLGAYLQSTRAPRPARFRCIGGVETEAELLREDDRTLVLRVPDGLLSGFFVQLLRDRERGFPEDFRVVLSDVTITIAERSDTGEPVALRLALHAPPDDPRYVFLAWSPRSERFEVVTLPPPGESLSLDGESIIDLLLGS